MKILFVEDTDSWVNEFLPQLQTLGEVVHFKSRNLALNSLYSQTFDLIVCDHNILLFEQESRFAYGTDVYNDDRWAGNKTPFIHFSCDPCPEKYLKEDDDNFYSLKKDHGLNLLDFIKNKVSLKQ